MIELWAEFSVWCEALFLSRAGAYIVMLGILSLIVLFLRILFGPRGLFRDPQWDVWNEEARRKKEAMQREQTGKP